MASHCSAAGPLRLFNLGQTEYLPRFVAKSWATAVQIRLRPTCGAAPSPARRIAAIGRCCQPL